MVQMRSKLCPKCKIPLNSINSCDQCEGRLTGFSVLNIVCPAGLLKRCLDKVKSQGLESSLKCPDCSVNMRTLGVPDCEPPLSLDFCLNCQALWFDANEIARLPKKSALEREQSRKSVDGDRESSPDEDGLKAQEAGLEIVADILSLFGNSF